MASQLKDDRVFSAEGFAAFGLDRLIYVKTVADGARISFSVHGADGTPLAVMDERAVAFAAVLQQGMEPLSVH